MIEQSLHGCRTTPAFERLREALVRRVHDSALADELTVRTQRQKELLHEFHSAAPLEQRTQPWVPPNRTFILTTKDLTLLGFFTSQPGATQVLQYVAIPGAYHGCLPVHQGGNGKRWAT